MKQIILFALVCVLNASAIANPFQVPKSTDNCGSRFEIFRRHFIEAGLPEKFVRKLSEDAMDGFQAFAAKQMDSPVPTADVRKPIENILKIRANERGGFVDIASCWHSLNSKSDFDFEENKQMIKDVDFTIGTQVLEWLTREWCADVWASIFLDAQSKLKFRLPPFRPLLWCRSFSE